MAGGCLEWRGAPWGGHLGRQTEPRWDLQMAGGVERSGVGRTLRWADGAALGNTDGGRSGEERSGEDSQLCGQTESRWNLQMVGGVERRGEDS